MPTQNTPPNTPAASNTPLARARDQNEAAQQSIEKSVVELELINTVLQQELPDHVQSQDVALALEKNSELESKIQDTANDLAEVNETLTQEIAEREALEHELARTKAALQDARNDTPNT